MTLLSIEEMRSRFGPNLQENELLSRHTTARVGGPADFLLTVDSVQALAQAVMFLWHNDLPFLILGGGSNVLASDSGVRGVVLLNRARRIVFSVATNPPTVWAESGANFGALARQACQRGLGGLEWAVGVPGSVGGAVVGNAGAHDGDMAGNVIVAEILHRNQVMMLAKDQNPVAELLMKERLEYSYRSSTLKRYPGQAVVLAARLSLLPSTPEAAEEKADTFTAYRQRTQPPGATIGSMFKNPPGDFAGRLIEAAGLKGLRSGDAEISQLHANFFVNRGQATAGDIFRLIETAQKLVAERFGVTLELEVELVGDWQAEKAAE